MNLQAQSNADATEKNSRRWRGMRLMSVVMCAAVMCAALLMSSMPLPVQAQDSAPAPAASADDQTYSSEQLDALLAPVALYPDQLLTQVLMASTYADEVQAANAWVQAPANKGLADDALDKALAAQDWDPSVKSLVPFPQVLSMLAAHAEWMDQLGYAMNVQQSDVMASVQRLRAQAQNAGQLKSSGQQIVSTQGSSIVIAPAQPDVVYVPSYNPAVVYGAWPYPAYPPVYYPPPPAYGLGGALLTGMAFGAGVAIRAGLWGWASPDWGHGNVDVNVNRYNNINVNRPPILNGNWNGNRPGGGLRPPGGGPVGMPRPQRGMPANSIGRPSVSVPGSIARPPAGIGVHRPGGGSIGKSQTGGNMPSMGGGNRPNVKAPAAGNRGGGGPGAFSGIGDGGAASQYSNRGAQSQQARASGGGVSRGGGGGGRQK